MFLIDLFVYSEALYPEGVYSEALYPEGVYSKVLYPEGCIQEPEPFIYRNHIHNRIRMEPLRF